MQLFITNTIVGVTTETDYYRSMKNCDGSIHLPLFQSNQLLGNNKSLVLQTDRISSRFRIIIMLSRDEKINSNIECFCTYVHFHISRVLFYVTQQDNILSLFEEQVVMLLVISSSRQCASNCFLILWSNKMRQENSRYDHDRSIDFKLLRVLSMIALEERRCWL